MRGRIARLHYRLGVCLAWWGWNWGAARACRDATQADPAFFDAHLLRGEALVRRKSWYAASRAFREAARLRPTDVDVQGSLAFALGQAGLWDEAVTTLRRLAHLRPLQAEVHVLVAAIQRLKLRRPDESIRSYRWAIRLELPPRGVRFHLAEAILGATAWDEALTAFREAKGLAPGPVSEAPEKEPGRSVLHHHPGGPVAVPIRPRPSTTALPESLRPLARAWQRFGQIAQAAQHRAGRAMRILAGAASAAEQATLLHCYHQVPGSAERAESHRGRPRRPAVSNTAPPTAVPRPAARRLA